MRDEAHKAAAERFGVAIDVECRLEHELPSEARQSSIREWKHKIVETDDPRWIAALQARDVACDACDELAWAFIETPTTAAGAAALAAYMGDACEGHFPDGCEQAVLRVLAKALARTAGGASCS